MGLSDIKNTIFGENNRETSDDVDIKKTVREGMETGSNKVILFEPRAYSESTQIADYLKNSSTVLVKLQRVTPDQAKRIVDFLSGTLYALQGDIQKLGQGIFLCTPNSIKVEGKLTDESKEVKNKKVEQKEGEDIDW